jgi:hypothetical protein
MGNEQRNAEDFESALNCEWFATSSREVLGLESVALTARLTSFGSWSAGSDGALAFSSKFLPEGSSDHGSVAMCPRVSDSVNSPHPTPMLTMVLSGPHSADRRHARRVFVAGRIA